MNTIFESCEPRLEVLRGELREEIFAARLKDVIDDKADPVYQDPETFFENTYPTEGLRLLLDESLGRLTGLKPANNAIIRLETAFGGGKTHNLIALYHAANGFAPGPAFVESALIPTPGMARVVGVVGSDLQPRDGLDHRDLKTYTLWGELAYQLGGTAGYVHAAGSDQDRSAPGTGLLETLIGGDTALIMLDEVARHLRAAKTVPTVTRKSDLAEQTVAFLMSLFEFAASQERVVVVLTLADSRDAFGKETEELRQDLAEARRLSARQERVITPTGEAEIAAIVTHRLFRSIQRDAAHKVVRLHTDYYRRLIDQGANLPQRAIRAEYAEEMAGDYPFHPELLTTLNRKTSTIPNFQKTRGALRLLAMVIRRLWETRPPGTYLIHPFHLDLGVEGIANDLTSRLDRPAFKQVIEADIVSPRAGSQAHAQVIDTPWLEAGKPPYAGRAAAAAFLHSLTQGVATGVDPADLALAVLTPDDDPAMVTKATERMVDACWFFDWDGHRYRFKTEPSLNKIIADEMGMVGRTKAKAELDHRIRQVWKTGHLKPVYFASEAGDVDDDADKPKLVIVHYDADTSTPGDPAPPDLIRRIFDHAGSLEGYRTYKNNVLFLAADEDQVENMVEVAQRYLAIGRIVGDAERMREFNSAISTEDLRRAFARRMGLRILLDLNQLKKTIRNGVSQGVWIYYDSAEEPGYGADSPLPAIQIIEDTLLYTPEEARRIGLTIKGEEPDVGNGREATCPVCQRPVSRCACGHAVIDVPEATRIHAEGAPAQAFQGVLDQCGDQGVGTLRRLFIRLEGHGKEGATEARSLGLAIPQLGRGEYHVDQKFNAEFGDDGSLSLSFTGGWDRYKRLKQVTDAFGQEAGKLLVQTTLRPDFPDGLLVNSDQFQTIHEVFTTLGFGRMVIDAEPFADDT